MIEHAPPVGFYLKVFEGLYVFEGGRCSRDYLQDTVEQAMTQAEEDFGVPRAVWRQVA